MGTSIELERLEKTSTLVRNIVLILGALITCAFYLADKLTTDITVHVNTLYLGGENTIISFPRNFQGEDKIISGRLSSS